MNSIGISETSPLLKNANLPDQALGRLDRREWWLQGTAIAVMLLLAIGIYSCTIVLPPTGHDVWWQGSRREVPALFAVILLFAIFAFHRQRLVSRLRRQLSMQANLMAGLQTRAEILHKLAILDPLTGLYNRRFVMQHLPTELARAQRHACKLTVMCFDLNGLKEINDSYGHPGGDAVLREFGAALRRALRSSDIAARISGDEFLAILPECGAADMPQVLSRLSRVAAEHGSQRIEIRFSAGWAEYIEGDDAEALLERADRHLYEDKRTGRAERQAMEAQEQLRQKEKLTTMGRITTGVAHDFNNLLAVIKGYADLILEGLDRTSAAYPQMEEIQKAAARATALVGQLLAFTRKQAAQPAVVDLNQLLAGMSMMLQRLVGSHVALSLEPAAGLPSVFVDAGQTEQVLMHLVANAREAMPRGGSLSITTGDFEMGREFCARHPGARPGRYAWLALRDTGPGLDREAREHLFEPSWIHQEIGRSTGLGLLAVYGFAKQHGGYVWVDAEAGQGTCITIYLPAVGAASASGEEKVLALPAADGPASTTVLVVEELDSLRGLMTDCLRQEGYDVLAAATGDEAMRLATEAGRIDLAICDVVLPGMSGIELMECIVAQHGRAKALYIGSYEEEARFYRQHLRPGARLLVAPFSFAEFSQVLRELLAVQV
jgi:diguanylate cyclase (GGDEF)-like protein